MIKIQTTLLEHVQDCFKTGLYLTYACLVLHQNKPDEEIKRLENKWLRQLIIFSGTLIHTVNGFWYTQDETGLIIEIALVLFFNIILYKKDENSLQLLQSLAITLLNTFINPQNYRNEILLLTAFALIYPQLQPKQKSYTCLPNHDKDDADNDYSFVKVEQILKKENRDHNEDVNTFIKSIFDFGCYIFEEITGEDDEKTIENSSEPDFKIPKELEKKLQKYINFDSKEQLIDNLERIFVDYPNYQRLDHILEDFKNQDDQDTLKQDLFMVEDVTLKMRIFASKDQSQLFVKYVLTSSEQSPKKGWNTCQIEERKVAEPWDQLLKKAQNDNQKQEEPMVKKTTKLSGTKKRQSSKKKTISDKIQIDTKINSSSLRRIKRHESTSPQDKVAKILDEYLPKKKISQDNLKLRSPLKTQDNQRTSMKKHSSRKFSIRLKENLPEIPEEISSLGTLSSKLSSQSISQQTEFKQSIETTKSPSKKTKVKQKIKIKNLKLDFDKLGHSEKIDCFPKNFDTAELMHLQKKNSSPIGTLSSHNFSFGTLPRDIDMPNKSETKKLSPLNIQVENIRSSSSKRMVENINTHDENKTRNSKKISQKVFKNADTFNLQELSEEEKKVGQNMTIESKQTASFNLRQDLIIDDQVERAIPRRQRFFQRRYNQDVSEKCSDESGSMSSTSEELKLENDEESYAAVSAEREKENSVSNMYHTQQHKLGQDIRILDLDRKNKSNKSLAISLHLKNDLKAEIKYKKNTYRKSHTPLRAGELKFSEKPNQANNMPNFKFRDNKQLGRIKSQMNFRGPPSILSRSSYNNRQNYKDKMLESYKEQIQTLEKKLENNKIFLNMVIHDLRNPTNQLQYRLTQLIEKLKKTNYREKSEENNENQEAGSAPQRNPRENQELLVSEEGQEESSQQIIQNPAQENQPPPEKSATKLQNLLDQRNQIFSQMDNSQDAKILGELQGLTDKLDSIDKHKNIFYKEIVGYSRIKNTPLSELLRKQSHNQIHVKDQEPKIGESNNVLHLSNSNKAMLQVNRPYISELDGKIKQLDRIQKEIDCLDKVEFTEEKHDRQTQTVTLPLSTHTNIVDLEIQAEYQKIDAGEILSSLENCVYCSTMLLSLINDLLDLAKLQKMTFELNNNFFDLNKTIDQTFLTLEYFAKQKEICPKFIIDPEIEPFFKQIYGDQGRFTQIFLNFLSNAFKFTPNQGNISVEIKKIPQIEFYQKVQNIKNDEKLEGLKIEDDESLYFITFQIRIKDSGRGISPENTKKLFLNFSKLADEEGINKQGTGLGLSICKLLIERMGGEVGIQSDGIGKGTTFLITMRAHTLIKTNLVNDSDKIEEDGEKKEIVQKELKQYEEVLIRARSNRDLMRVTSSVLNDKLSFMQSGQVLPSEKHQQIQEVQNDVAQSLSQLRVLIINDEFFILDVLKQMVEQVEIKNIDTAENGFDGYQMVLKNDYDFILCDLQMPGMNGYECVKKIKAAFQQESLFYDKDHQSVRACPLLIACSALITEETEQKAFAVGFDLAVQSPISIKFIQEEILTRVFAKIHQQKYPEETYSSAKQDSLIYNLNHEGSQSEQSQFEEEYGQQSGTEENSFEGCSVDDDNIPIISSNSENIKRESIYHSENLNAQNHPLVNRLKQKAYNSTFNAKLENAHQY